MRTGIRRAAIVALSSVLLGATNTLPASAAETTPPRLNLPPYAAFLQGGQIGESPPGTPAQPTFTSNIPMYIQWSGSDASGICGYDVLEEYAGRSPGIVVAGTTKTRYDGRVTDYDDQQGGGASKVVAWRVDAHDCAGNSTSKSAGVRANVMQEDGTSNGGNPATIGYKGTWGTSSCTCWSHGAVRRTTQQGAAATISYSAAANSTIAVVMEKAPGRGKFTLLLDGVNKGTIDTFAPTATHRIIVWAGRLTTAGNHVIKIVNQATPGRPRIDLDAVLLN